MQIGFVGLGRMGGNMSRRILRDSDHEVIAFDPSEGPREEAAEAGANAVASLEDLVAALDAPRHVWMMVPSGAATQQTTSKLFELLSPDDVVIDGGNSRWTDSKANAALAAEQGIHFVDVGTSGGIWGLERGYCMMVGGEGPAVERLAPVLDVLAPPDGWSRVGPSGSGHYVKMIHNGVEYALLQGYAEGFELLHASEFDLELSEIAHLWNQGSVIRSWLLELAERAFEAGGDLEQVRGYVEDSGEGRWTVLEAIDKSVPAPAIVLALMSRFSSRQEESYSAQVIAALRAQFGGHAVRSR